MLRGVRAALEDPSVQPVLDSFVLETFDDLGDLERAREISEWLATDPATLAVIGHATSGTTRVAAEYYDDAGIPLIMPIATSPLAARPRHQFLSLEDRFDIAFRLPPADDKIQAPALAIAAVRDLGAKRVYLVRDDSETAREYSTPLFEELWRLLETVRVGAGELGVSLNASPVTFTAAAMSVRAEAPDVVVFCGYGTTAQRLLQALRDAYKDVEFGSRPVVLLTDGARIPDLTLDGFRVFLTFPTPDVEHFTCPGQRGARIRELLAQQQAPSYEVFGYDAMLFLSDAIASCSKSNSLSRQCILSSLTSRRFFDGACFGYQFIRGENTLADYFLYANLEDASKLSFWKRIAAESIAELSDSGE